MIDALDKLFESMIVTVGGVNRVSYLSTKPLSGGPNIQAIVRDSRRFVAVAEQIREKVSEAATIGKGQILAQY